MPRTRFQCYAFAAGLYLATRFTLYAAGFEFNLDLHWMFLADPTSLRENLGETLWFFHAFPPGMNILTAALLALPSSLQTIGAVGVFWAAGIVLLLSLAAVLERVGFGRSVALLASLTFSLLPPSLYFEGLYLYTYPCAALLCLGMELFCLALDSGRFRSWLLFFLCCAALGWVRTTFHLIWFVAMVGFAVMMTRAGVRRRVLGAALAPLILLSSLYIKNWAVFGVFGTTSWSGANLTLVTTARMARSEREAWIRQGIISPFSRLSVFAPPKSYLPLMNHRGKRYPWPGSNDLWRREVREANFNHGLFIEVNNQRRKDALAFIGAVPSRYWKTVGAVNFPAFFGPSTHWHPNDSKPNSPHRGHRTVLGWYESAFDRLVHSFPSKGVGLYWLLPFVMLAAVWRGFRELRNGTPAKAGLLGFCLIQIGFVTLVSSLLTAQESSRYRYLVEPCIAVLVLGTLREWSLKAACGFRAAVSRSGSAFAAGRE